MSAAFSVCGAIMLAILLWIAHDIVDSVWLSEQFTIGVVEDVSFRVAHVDSGIMIIGKTILPTTTPVPDKWFLNVSTNKGSGVLELEHAPWDWQTKGHKVLVHYSIGRLSGDVYINNLIRLDMG